MNNNSGKQNADKRTSQQEIIGPYWREYNAFTKYFIWGRRIPLLDIIVLGLKSALSIFEMLIRYIPGGFGYKIRYYYYKPFLKRLGKNVLIDIGVIISGPKNISIGDYCWLDAHCMINAFLGPITIGRRVHVGPYAIIASRAPIEIEDYVGVGSSAKIYSNSERPGGGKRMTGPLVPEEMKAFYSAPVILRKDSFIGANSVILPGVVVGEGAVAGANSVITKSVGAWEIVIDRGTVIGKREKVTMPDI